MARTAVLLCLVMGAVAPVASAAGPVILPGPKHVRAGHASRFELIAPPRAKRCALSARGGHRHVGPFRVTLGGASRTARWKVSRSARGRWVMRVSCSTAHGRRLGVTRRALRVGKHRRTGGKLIRPGSFRAVRGWIPDRAPARRARRRDVENEMQTGARVACANSSYIAAAYAVGSGVATRLGVEPKPAAFDTTDPDGLWRDMENCLGGLPPLSDSQYDSMFKQMVCHIAYAVFGGAGDSWDVEAWREDVSWFTAMNPLNKCQGWGNVTVSEAGAFLGHIVHGSTDDAAQQAAWLIDNVDGFWVRRHVLTSRAYYCLKDTGHAGPDVVASDFLTDMLPEGQPVDDSVCPAEPAPTPAPASAPQPNPQPTPQPDPAPPTNHYYETTGGETHTWTNYNNAGGYEGPTIAAYRTVEVACKVIGFAVANGNRWWYRIASDPWSNNYFASADAFYNNGNTSGSLAGTPYVDPAVPDC